MQQKHLGDAETKDRLTDREAEREGGRRRKEDKEDLVESREVEGRPRNERERKGREKVEYK